MRRELPLTGYEFESPETASLAARTCARHLALLGAMPRVRAAPVIADREVVRLARSDNGAAANLICDIAWPATIGASARDAWREVTLQATSGLMALHGVDAGRPRRLGLDVVSNALGIVACQALLAGTLACLRGSDVEHVAVLPAGAAMLVLAHHLAAATCGDRWRPPTGGSAPGPPFATRDGHYVELEVLDPEGWGTFWSGLGVPASELGAAWLAFAFRHVTGTCHLPAALHDATSQRSVAELRRAADACSVGLVVVRGYAEVLPEWLAKRAPWDVQSLDSDSNAKNSANAGARDAAGTTAAPLTGIRVVDATSRIQGPLAGRLLALLGADVVHVEPPGGDPARDAPPTAGTVGAAYLTYNHGKRVVELDYKTRAGRSELLDLIAEADVFMHNWRAGRDVAMHLASSDLTRVRPNLVYAHATGWGNAAGAGLPAVATDFIVQAHVACGAGLNPESEQPFPSRLTLVDVTGGLVAAEGILAALLVRERTGRGCTVSTSLFGSALDMQHSVLDGIASGNEHGRRLGRPLWDGLDQPLKAADGYVVVDTADAGSRHRIARACRVGDADPSAVSRAMQSQPAEAVTIALRAEDVQCESVRTDLADLSRDPTYGQAVEAIDGACDVPGSPWCFK